MPPVEFGNIVALVAFLSSVVFVVGYSVIAPWWRYQVGRTVVSLDAAIAITLFPSVLHRWLGVPVASAFLAWYADFSVLLVAAITLWRLWSIYRLQQDGLHNSNEEEQ